MDQLSDTPRTDAFAQEPLLDVCLDNAPASIAYRKVLGEWCDFARQLERELSAARAEVERLKKEREIIGWVCNDGGALQLHQRNEELAALLERAAQCLEGGGHNSLLMEIDRALEGKNG